ncbi:DUF5666 domain-containing protein [Actinacidiphila bryophytorum]|uniref:DUF5666 domain-containing protein n=1 Tax=Actinacidiphila bryophytorum TaxID=1436133 RepID=A0A9W4H529_9ACTN|nr:DUF5666 domain-containing protein [Actinacidiphila bryophytorum]MBM9437436.1 hypothetical protein [Actinacidiphila bryophytorum]MBN6547000.1 hypothetical protein [Actinacidiphila bryophytorum]CAG7652118.1 conserved hypothetical protein [Actinacidiphila bryophytorum]
MARRRSELVKADDSGTDLLPLVPEQGAGGIEIRRGSDLPDVIEGHGGLPAQRPEDILAEPPDARDISAELAAPPRRKLPWLTLLLSAGVVAAAAFAGGALVEKHHLHGTASASSPFAGFGGARSGTGAGAGRFGGGGATAGTGAAAAAGLTFGTVKLVDGSTIYVTDAQGNTVKVTTGASTKVTESKDGKVSDLKPGQTVTVRGSKGASGDITATTVTQGATPPAGSGGFSGFGGFGGFQDGGTGGN